MKAITYSQGHITGFFKIYPNGSTGAGFNIKKAMKTEVTAEKSLKNSFTIFINGKRANAVTSKIVLEKIFKKTKNKYKISVNHSTEFPIGFGLGLSGAGAFSLAEALNKAMRIGLSKKEIVSIASEADIEAGTGLGDVIAEQFNGAIMGLPPYPSKKVAKIRNNYKYAVFGFFGEISTKKIIRSKKWKKKINKIGSYCMRKMNNKQSIGNFIHLSRIFAVETGLATKKVGKIMDSLPNSSMAMLGNTVFVLTNNPKKIEKRLKKHAKKISIAKIS